MVNIDYIMNLLDWKNSMAKQNQGIRLAQGVKCINVFFQPNIPYGKRVWENCAKVLSQKTNEELSPYLIEMMEWLQDMNWPGASCIYEKIKLMTDDPLFSYSYETCLKCAKALEDESWENNLKAIFVQ